jgi:hypothetical protein
MGILIYGLCALTSTGCAILLWRSFVASRAPLLFWSALCFVLLSANNVLLVLDEVVFPVEVDLRIPRLLLAVSALAVLIYGLVWEE